MTQSGTATDSSKPVTGGPKGIGGWLILPLIGLVITPPLVIFQTVAGIMEEMQAAGSESFTAADLSTLLQLTWTDWLTVLVRDPSSVLGLIVGVVSLFFVLFLVFGSIFCLVLMLRKSSLFPTVVSIFYAVTTVFSVGIAAAFLADVIEVTSDDKQEIAKEAVQSVITTAIWIPYFRVSKRVKNTFVR